MAYHKLSQLASCDDWDEKNCRSNILLAGMNSRCEGGLKGRSKDLSNYLRQIAKFENELEVEEEIFLRI